ncbi:MAG TPA: MFS transporter [Chitinophagales bacterium]|nr:MFS transporter [Chitinophagales bacterium]HNL84848.1 MFS transporter [Chitinophagales bacterium]
MLSLVSLFTDMASEMLYPVMPVYLKKIGFSVLLIGILEGIAEAVAGLSKSYFGKLSDVSGKRVPFVQFGYGLSAISKPLLATFIYPVWVFLCRTLDRVGKGIRTGARDALLSDEATPETKATVFGFHRSMDTLGAVLGPALALVFLYYHPEQYKTLFLIAFIPGVMAIAVTALLRESKKTKPNVTEQSVSFFTFINYWKDSPLLYKRLLLGLLLFALFNSSDVFLLLKLKQEGMSDTTVIGVYIFYNLVYALLAFPVGILADILGLKRLYLSGLFAFVFVYVGMSFNGSVYYYLLLFLLYGYYAAATEGIAKAWISNISEKKDTATAIGTYSGLQSICALFASAFAGWLWFGFGAQATFITTGIMAIWVAIYLWKMPYKVIS